MADLVVRAADLQAVADALRPAVEEAAEMPPTVNAAHIQLDMRGGPVAKAAAELCEAWYVALDMMADSGRAVLEWLADVDEEYARVEQELAPRPGR